MIHLRLYQQTAIDRLRERFRAGVRRIVLASPVGSGKTVIAATVVKLTVARGNRVLFLAHRRELIEQCSKKLDDIGVDHGVIAASHWRHRPWLPVQVASIQTLTKRIKPPAELVVIDECHRTLCRTLTDLVAAYQNAMVLGLSGTPYRGDGRGLGRIYQEIVETASVQELVDQGYLIAPRVFAPYTPDLDGVKTTAGDYQQDELARRMDKSELVGDVVEHWQRLAAGRRTVVFASSVEHSRHIAESFTRAGIRAAHIDGGCKIADRDRILAQLTKGEIDVLCNCDLLVEGWDVPVLSCCILARPTQSQGRYIQMIGRVLRTVEGKSDAIILDHAGCVLAHGFPTDAREYSLEDVKREKKASVVKVCKICFAVMPAFTATCPECGGEQPRMAAQRVGPVERDGELHELQPEKPGACEKCGSENTHTIRTQKLGQFTRGVKCRDCGAVVFRTLAAAKRATREEKLAEWERIEKIRREKGFKKGWSSWRYKSLFGCWPRGMPRDEAEASA